MKRVVSGVGFIMLMLGAASFDSPSLIIPIIFCILGALLMLFTMKEER